VANRLSTAELVQIPRMDSVGAGEWSGVTIFARMIGFALSLPVTFFVFRLVLRKFVVDKVLKASTPTTTTRIREFDYFLAWIINLAGGTITVAMASVTGGFGIRVALWASGLSEDHLRVVGTIVGVIFGIPVSYVVYRLIVAKFLVGKLEKHLSISELSSGPVQPS
jgi:hypothetical protein